MKKTLSLILLLTALITNAQNKLYEPISETLIDIPYIGNNGGAHLLNWKLKDDKLHLLAYSHINGSLIVTNPQTMASAKSNSKGKSIFGKILDANKVSNSFEKTIIPVVYEKTISAIDFSELSSKKELFHKVDDIPENDYVYFKKPNGFINLNFGVKEGDIIKHHYKDLNQVFPNSPKYNKNIIDYTTVVTKGEGLLGLKNLKPYLIYKKGFFTYDKSKGYISKTEEKTLQNLSENENLKGFSIIENSQIKIGNYYFAWFMELNNFNTYKLMSYNIKDEKIDVKTFDFKVPRKFKVMNKVVTDEKLKNTKGLVNIFGYHRKGKKNTDVYPKNTFDFIYINPKGEVVIDKKIKHGTEKNFKNVISPIIITENNNGELNFMNNNQLSLLKANLEYFTLNKDGEIKVNSTEKYFKFDGKNRYNYYQYLSKFDHIDRMGDYFILRKIIAETPKTPSADGTSKKIKSRVNITILDKNFKPIHFQYFSIDPNLDADLSFQNILMTNSELITLIKKNKSHFILKTSLNKNDASLKTTLKRLQIDLSQSAIPTPYFGAFNQNFSLVDKKNRVFYIMSQIYDTKTYGTKVIDKVGITKFEY